jgi:hypothetical protein
MQDILFCQESKYSLFWITRFHYKKYIDTINFYVMVGQNDKRLNNLLKQGYLSYPHVDCYL